MKFIKLISISSLIAVGALLEAKTWIFSYIKTDSGDLCFAKGSDLKNWEYIGGKDRAFFNSNLGAWGDKKIKGTIFVSRQRQNLALHMVYILGPSKPLPQQYRQLHTA